MGTARDIATAAALLGALVAVTALIALPIALVVAVIA